MENPMRNWIGFKTILKREMLRMFKAPAQTFFPPIISSVLFILIFGFFIGDRIAAFGDVDFTAFFIPGLIMMNVIITAYSNSAFSLFLKRFLRDINDLLVTPLSYGEIVMGFILGGTIRALIIGVVIFIIAYFFTSLTAVNILLFLFFVIGVSFIFSGIGIVVGLWSETFEQVEMFTVFLITPLTFLGGVFHSIKLLPPLFQQITALNPFFYMIDGLRYAMIGQSEGNLFISVAMVLVLGVAIFWWNMHLFRSGWKLRT
jgi:ABC-2 type transport system permease protein